MGTLLRPEWQTRECCLNFRQALADPTVKPFVEYIFPLDFIKLLVQNLVRSVRYHMVTEFKIMNNELSKKSTHIHHWMGIALSLVGFITYYGFPSLSVSSPFKISSEEIDSDSFGLPDQAEIHVASLDDVYKDMTYPQVKEIFRKKLHGADKKKASALAHHLLDLAAKYEISPSIILSIIKSESAFHFDAESDLGAYGIMQVKPNTAAYIAERDGIKTYKSAQDLYDPMINMSVGVAYVSYLRELFGDSEQYVAAYNLGPTTVSHMLSTHTFTLGKVTKYVTEIHANVRILRDSSGKTLVADQF